MIIVKSRYFVFFISATLILCCLFVIDLLQGSVHISVNDFIHEILFGDNQSINASIIYQIRLPKAITAILAGMALSVSGLQLQTIFRNPLAGPHILGISAGAGFGVAMLIMGITLINPLLNSFFSNNTPVANFIQSSLKNMQVNSFSIIIAASLGAASVLLLIFIIALRIKDIMTLLIIGIMIGSALSALVSVLQYFSNETNLKIFVIWTMGSLSGVTLNQLQQITPVILVGLLISFISSKKLNIMQLGENYAKSMGLNISTTIFTVFFSTSILSGTITAFCGPIGFIGITVPHITRLILKTSNHLVLIPATMLLGAIIMLLSDLISMAPGSNITLPINSVTSLLGIPIVLLIIIKSYNKR